MGENSIINISESRAVNDWQFKRLSDVQDIWGGVPREIGRFASGLDRIARDRATRNRRKVDPRHEIEEDKHLRNSPGEQSTYKERRPVSSRSLSTIEPPISLHSSRLSSSAYSTSQHFSPRARFLVALILAVLLHPTMAIPRLVGDDAAGDARPSLFDSPYDRQIRDSDSSLLRNDLEYRFMDFPRKHARDAEEDEENGFPASLAQSGREMRSQRLLHEPELDTIRRSIVEGLGLERIPDPSKANVSQTEYRRAHVEYLTRLQRSRDNDDTRLRKLHTFHPAERSRSLSNRSVVEEEASTAGVLHFPMGSIPLEHAETEIDHASLRFLLDAREANFDLSRHAISLYRLVTPNSREFVSQRRLSSSEERDTRWIELDATEITLEHYRQGDPGDLKVELVLESLEDENELDSGARGRNSKKNPSVSQAALNVFTTSWRNNNNVQESSGRVKRRANPSERLMSLHKGRRTECRGENKKCCRHEMTVTFKDLKGFEFIVQPKNYDAGYCKGRCPPRYNPAHHHALLQSLIWKEDRRKAPRPCCAPSKLEELEILYFDENDPTKLKISTWKNMRVLECACS